MRKIRIAVACLLAVPLIVLSLFYAFLPAGLFMLFGAKKAANRWLELCARLISNGTLFALGVKIHVDGRENLPAEANICYMANHQSMLDILAFTGPAKLWASVFAKAELKKVPVVNLWCFALGCVFIERTSPHDAVKAILKGVQRLKEGKAMLIFPEGTRSKVDAIGELKNGSLKLATRSQAIIVPITIKGLRSGLEGITNFRRVHAYFSIGKPIHTASLSKDEIAMLHERVYGEVKDRFNELPN
ncbi:MAG TPA: lysophospholipid acyltransferase family protein [Sphaerochaeta sp.]|nr:lysophospholipid acyltransferase family protein [Sphaerochaeta sp.]